MKKLIYVFMFLFLAAGVMAADKYLEIQTSNWYVNITNEGNVNKIGCGDSNYFKYKLGADCNSNAANSALNSCQTELSNLINGRDYLVNENKELKLNNFYLNLTVTQLQKEVDIRRNRTNYLEGRQDTIKTYQTACEKDLIVCKTERGNEKDNSFLNIIRDIFFGGLITILIIVCLIIKFRKDKGGENNCGRNVPEKRPAKDLDNSF